MSRETQVPAIPDVRDDNELAVLRAIKNTLDVREGRIGDALDQYVTLRDLTDIGVLTLGVGSPLTNGTIVPVVIPGSDPDGYDPSSDFIPPPQPTGLTASGAFSNVILAWTAPNYRNHAYTEIWRSQTNTLGTAVRVGTTVANVYADPAIEGQTYYYWIRFVSQANVAGSYNATSGTTATTATSPTVLLSVLTGQITATQLATSLTTRIDLIDGPVGMAGSVAAQVYAEQQARIAADNTLGSSITTLTNTTNTQASQITSLTTRTTTAETNITNLQSTSTSQASSITSLTTRMGTAESNITSLQTTTSTQATSITSLTTRVGTAETNITNLQTSDASQATSISTLTTTVGGHTTTLSTQATSISGLQAQYTVKIDSNGYVTGYGLASTAVNGTPTSTFIVRADDFSIANPTGPSIPPAMPFIVRTTSTTINGETVPVGVYITDAFIQNGTIVSAKIGNLAVDTAKIADLAVTSAKISSLDAGKITTGTLDAARIAAGSLTADKIGAGTITASVSLTAATITGGSLNINNKFVVDSAGTVTISSATTGSRLVITNSLISVYDASNVLRVRLGTW